MMFKYHKEDKLYLPSEGENMEMPWKSRFCERELERKEVFDL